MSSLLLNHLWQSTLFGGLAAAAAWLLRREGAHIRHGIWVVASAKFLLPFSMLATLLPHALWQSAPQSSVQILVAVQAFAAPVSVQQDPVTTYAASYISVQALLFAIWAAGAAALLVRTLLKWIDVRAVASAARPIALDAGIPVRSTRALLEPGVFGFLRPVLLLPEHIGRSLPPAEIEAILAHELAHVRRFDNLTAALQMLVELVFWFHPLVWWIGRRLIEERERACDEAVLRAGIDRQTYAMAIVNVCKLCQRVPLACAAGVGGGRLTLRVRAILDQPLTQAFSRLKRALLASAGIVTIAALSAAGLAGQSTARAASPLDVQPNGPRFAHVIVEPADTNVLPNTTRVGFVSGRFMAERASLKQLISFAYSDGETVRISGGPSWADSLFFNVYAVAEPHDLSAERVRAMVRTALADRFGLRLRRESRPVYILQGPAEGAPHGAGPRQSRQAGPTADAIRQRDGWLIGNGATTGQLANALSRHLSSPVLDHTRLRGTYDFRVTSRPGVDADALARQLRRQLGLTLKSFPREQLIIEQAERPTAPGPTL
jgi:bla regulator protein blaR1